MERCEDCKDVPVCCDHCKHYEFNGNEKGHYTGDGMCTLHDTNKNPGQVCDDYYCKTLDRPALVDTNWVAEIHDGQIGKITVVSSAKVKL